MKNLPRFLSDSQILSEEVSDQGDENQPRDKSEGSIRQLKIVLSEPQDAPCRLIGHLLMEMID